ncbi:hypothetical protein D3C84_899780 [compost metagenome]
MDTGNQFLDRVNQETPDLTQDAFAAFLSVVLLLFLAHELASSFERFFEPNGFRTQASNAQDCLDAHVELTGSADVPGLGGDVLHEVGHERFNGNAHTSQLLSGDAQVLVLVDLSVKDFTFFLEMLNHIFRDGVSLSFYHHVFNRFAELTHRLVTRVVD